MKHRDEEQLISLAYGEMTADDAARVEASLSPKAARVLEDYRLLKNDLKLLNAVPAPQIGTERVREAILRQGLKRRHPLSRWSYILGPCLAAALGIAVLSPQTLTKPASRVAIGTESLDPTLFLPALQQPVLHPETEITNRSAAVREDIVFSQPDNDSGNGRTEAHAANPVKKHARRLHLGQRVDPGWVALAGNDQPAPAVAEPSAPPAFAESAPVTETAFRNPADDSGQQAQGDAKIIEVHQAQDRVTGAQQATEVDPNSNVFVGG